jgi:peptidoglycan hydrolase-like protein with peptidoglycan-binding domain
VYTNKESLEGLEPIKFSDNNDSVKALQTALEALGFKLSRFGVDSKFGSETLGQTKSLLRLIENNPSLQKMAGDVSLDISNNVVTPEIQKIIIALSKNEEARKAVEKHFSELSEVIGSTDIIFKDMIVQKIDDPEAFIAKLYEVSKKLLVNPNWLVYVMWMESKLETRARNKDTNATGLIQFIPSTAKGLGTSVDALYNMTSVEQMDYVYAYYKRFAGKMNSAEDVYFATFLPIAVGKDDNWVMRTQNASAATVAKQNPAVNLNKDSEITVGEFKDYIQKGIAATGHAQQINQGIA